MAPPKLFQGGAAASGTLADIKIPDSLYQFRHGKPCIALFKTLSLLKLKNKLEIVRFHPVVQKSVITYFLKAGGKHMHQEASDELRVIHGDAPFGIPRFFPLAEKVT